jgi:hypothetical protein
MNYQRRSLKGLLHHKPEKTFKVYNFFASLYGKDVWLMEMEGNLVHRLQKPLTQG